MRWTCLVVASALLGGCNELFGIEKLQQAPTQPSGGAGTDAGVTTDPDAGPPATSGGAPAAGTGGRRPVAGAAGKAAAGTGAAGTGTAGTDAAGTDAAGSGGEPAPDAGAAGSGGEPAIDAGTTQPPDDDAGV